MNFAFTDGWMGGDMPAICVRHTSARLDKKCFSASVAARSLSK